jgi:hypothetical protein
MQQKELSRLRSEQIKVYNVPVAVDSLQNIVDSLRSEYFIANSIVGRYELTLEHLYEVDPTAAKEFDDFMQHETE